MEFVALDVETANADMASICQIGLARYKNGSLVEEWKTYVDPEDYFDGINISIHGIDEATVKGSPTLPGIASCLCDHLSGRVSVCHTHFDRIAIRQAFTKYDLPVPSCTWLDSARVARRTWAEFARGGYGLKNVCEFLGYDFSHHDALEDAKAAAQVLLAAMAKTDLDVAGWLNRVERPIFSSPTSQQPGIAGMAIRKDLSTAKCWSSPEHSRFPVVRLRTWLLRSDALLQMALQRKPPSWL